MKNSIIETSLKFFGTLCALIMMMSTVGIAEGNWICVAILVGATLSFNAICGAYFNLMFEDTLKQAHAQKV